jgi:hypothetical protein
MASSAGGGGGDRGVFDIELHDVDTEEHTDDDESIELDDVSQPFIHYIRRTKRKVKLFM